MESTIPPSPHKMIQNHKHAFLYLLWLFSAWSLYVEYIYKGLSEYGIYGEIIRESMRFIIFLLPLYLLFLRTGRPKYSDFGFHDNFLKKISAGIVASIIYFAIAAPITMLSKGLDIGVESLSVTPMWTALTIAVVIEEIAFRGYLLNSFIQHGKTTAILVSSLFFMLIHFPGWWILDTHPSLASWLITSGSIFVLGVILGILFLRFNSLWICILVHSTNNYIAAAIR